MNLRESPVIFDCDGDQLVGIATLPAKPSVLGVLIVVGGPQYRVGSHRQFVHLARALAHQGYAAFRFDYRGMGDSGGAMRSFEHVERDIQTAACTFQTICPSIERLVVFGLCDAASAVLMAAGCIDGLAGMILANPWVRRDATLNAAVVRHYYCQRLFSGEFWRKLATGKLPMGSVASEFVGRVANLVRAGARDKDMAPEDFVDRMRAGWQLPICKLLLLSGQDITAREFEDVRSGDKRWAVGGEAGRLVEVRFADADHTFSAAQWRSNVSERCSRFLANLSKAIAENPANDG